MLWIKRNLFLVIGCAVALAMLGGAVWFVIAEVQADEQASTDLGQVSESLKTMLASDPRPTQENIGIIRNNTKKLKQFMTNAEAMFLTVTNQLLTPDAFQRYLAKTTSDLSHDATNANVSLPPRYAFTFGELAGLTTVPPYTIQPLTTELEEIRAICTLLFQSKVQKLESLQRVPIASADKPGNPEHTQRVNQTNAFSIAAPYTVTFRCFSAQLANVLNVFSRASQFLVVKTLEVAAEGSEAKFNDSGMMPGMPASGMPGMPPTLGVPPPPVGGGVPPPPVGGGAPPMLGMPGMPGIPGGIPGMPVRPPVPAKGTQPGKLAPTMTIVLDEKPLLVTMQVDFIKPYKAPKPVVPGKRPAAAAAPAAPAAMAN